MRHARVQVTYERLDSFLYLGHRRGVQELPLDGAEELEVDVTCDEEGHVQVSPSESRSRPGGCGRLHHFTSKRYCLRAVDGRTGATLRALEDLRLEQAGGRGQNVIL